jgi:hypothetical protein
MEESIAGHGNISITLEVDTFNKPARKNISNCPFLHSGCLAERSLVPVMSASFTIASRLLTV